mmetsp:Transcript_30541/g.54608  ORF Transcript_30541/g.54608 Transcript_30541/m.54608 type:complete len:675 (-) Transcript_30541:68-2092(-)
MGQNQASKLAQMACGATKQSPPNQIHAKSGSPPGSPEIKTRRPSLTKEGPKSPVLTAADRRTSVHAMYRLRCAEHGQIDSFCPVKLVVFDFDETLTLATFMSNSASYAPSEYEAATSINFESPWRDGLRVPKLRRMLEDIAQGTDGRRRTLAILTKNGNKAGVRGVLNLLEAAGLSEPFSAIWIMPYRWDTPNGLYKDRQGNWQPFNPPVDRVHGHKADVLNAIAANPLVWFPQLQGMGGAAAAVTSKPSELELLELKPENIVLVDDQRANFQSDSGVSVARYCKVARYDAEYLDIGFVPNMGGIGAHDDADYETLRRFVEDPWMCKETFQVRCQERDFENSFEHNPVQLVVFDFDETLTLATFMPTNPDCASEVGWKPSWQDDTDWNEADLIQYNFETPWVEGSRVQKLRQLLDQIKLGPAGERRSLAVLTRNQSGPKAVLNLLSMANLAEYFAAIWTVSPTDSGTVRSYAELAAKAGNSGPSGVYQQAGQWHCFNTPLSSGSNDLHSHKADILQHVAQNPLEWFPQLSRPDAGEYDHLKTMRAESVVLVDDERANFRSDSEGGARVLRYCKVARYDEVYRGAGLLNQMGGIGAHSDSDYQALKDFLQKPWEYEYEHSVRKTMKPLPSEVSLDKWMSERPEILVRETTADEWEQAPRRRTADSFRSKAQVVKL